MAKIRHIAMQVPELEKAAAFYEGVFELKRAAKVESPIGNAISLSDGVVNLTLLHFPEGTSASLLMTRARPPIRSNSWAASSSCSCRAIPALMPRRSSRI